MFVVLPESLRRGGARQRFAEAYTVSRETLEKFDAYAALIAEWSKRMNLIGASTFPLIWDRHFYDSAQLLQLHPHARGGTWLDIGAGAGFPGIVLALLGAGPIHLVESIGKKVAFLEAVVDQLGLKDTLFIHHGRVEDLSPFKVDFITARACAALPHLFEWGLPFARRETVWLLPKGRTVDMELAQARRAFHFEARLVESQTDPRARIVIAQGVRAIGETERRQKGKMAKGRTGQRA